MSLLPRLDAASVGDDALPQSYTPVRQPHRPPAPAVVRDTSTATRRASSENVHHKTFLARIDDGSSMGAIVSKKRLASGLIRVQTKRMCIIVSEDMIVSVCPENPTSLHHVRLNEVTASGLFL